jgi:integrase/recombinase XerC
MSANNRIKGGASMFEEFNRYLNQQDRSQLTIRGYLADLKAFDVWFQQTNGEALSPASITPSDIKEYRQYLLTVERAKAATINRRLAALSAYLNWAVQSGQIEKNPVAGIRSVQQVNQGPRYLDRKQQFALQRAVEKELQIAKLRYPKRWVARQRDCAMVVFLLNTGLRLNEAVSLKLEDVQLNDRKGIVWVRQGKGGKQRVVPLNLDARNVLRDWLNVRPEDGTDFIWIAVDGEQEQALSSRSVQRALTRIGRQAGLPALTPHMLRHSFAKNLIDSGVGLEKVASLLGHSSLNTTRIYVTPNQTDLERAVEQIAQY